MSNILRVVVTGPVAAGKSTFIRTISEIEVVDTDRQATDATADLKPGTTVAMDFGRITLGDDMWVHLYGTPGQARFNFMWDLLIQRAHGYILLIPAHLPGHVRAARSIRSFMAQRTSSPLVIGVTHVDHPEAWDLEDIQLVMGDTNPAYPYVLLNANDVSQVAQVLVTLVEQLTAPSVASVA